MELPVVDPRLSAQQAFQDDPVQRKLQIDALKERLAEPNKDEAAQRKLKEACQGFEAIFLQRIWEQMRKNVAKEGYLHSRDEESYQGMFDQELVKKMAEAGGIGLADMLQQQLSIKLGKASIASSPGILQGRQKILPLENPAMPIPTVPGFNDRPQAKTEDLYTPLNQEGGKQEAGQVSAQAAKIGELAAAKVTPARNDQAALSALTRPVDNPGRQPGMGMHSQFMLGAGLAARMGVSGNNSAIPAQGQAAQAGTPPLPGLNSMNMNQGNPALPGLNQMPAQATGLARPQDIGAAGEALAEQGALPPLPQLDSDPRTENKTSLFGQPGQPARAAEQPVAAETPRQSRRPRGFGGITMAEAENTVKKSNLNPFAQNWPVASTGAGKSTRFSGRRQQPEVGRAELEEPSVLRPPVQNMSEARAPRNEAEIKDIAPPNAEGNGIRQVSQAEVEAALRRMN